MHNYRGNIHVHSTYSDGTGTITEIAAAANRAGLDYIIITDHENRDGLPEEGMYGKTAVIVGTELNSEANHYLALKTRKHIDDYTGNPQKTIDEVNRQGGFGFLAHPFEKGSPLITDGATFPWTDLSVENYQGIELWNYCSQWKGEALSAAKMIYWYLFDRHAPVKKGPPVECLRFWDRQTLKRPVVAIGGTDAHAVNYRMGMGKFTVVIFPYEDLFRTINTHILLKEKLSSKFTKAKEQILDALRQGRCYISFDIYKPDNQFYFGAFNEEKEVPVGSELPFREGTSLKIHSPGNNSVIRIIRNGELLIEKKATQLTCRIHGSGTYRTEIYYCPKRGKPRPWLYSNPIYIK